MDTSKSVFASKTVWAGIAIILVSVAGYFGYAVTPGDQAALADHASAIANAVLGIAVIYGRIAATKQIAG